MGRVLKLLLKIFPLPQERSGKEYIHSPAEKLSQGRFLLRGKPRNLVDCFRFYRKESMSLKFYPSSFLTSILSLLPPSHPRRVKCCFLNEPH